MENKSCYSRLLALERMGVVSDYQVAHELIDRKLENVLLWLLDWEE